MDAQTAMEFEGDDSSLLVYDDRVEAVARKRTQVIAMADIASVQVSRKPRRLVIMTREGKQLQFNMGRDCEAARGAIARRLTS
jgi:hypothetical protein